MILLIPITSFIYFTCIICTLIYLRQDGVLIGLSTSYALTSQNPNIQSSNVADVIFYPSPLLPKFIENKVRPPQESGTRCKIREKYNIEHKYEKRI